MSSPIKIVVVGGSYGGIAALKNLLKLTSFENSAKRQFEITLIDPRAGFINIMAIPKMVVDLKYSKDYSFVPVTDYGIEWSKLFLLNDKAPQYFNSSKDHHFGQGGEILKKSDLVKVNFIQGYVSSLKENGVVYSRNQFIKRSTPSKFIAPTVSSNIGELNFDYCILASGRSRAWPFDPVASNAQELINEMSKSSNAINEAETVTIIGGGAVGIEVAGEIKHIYPNKTVQLVHPHSSLPPEPLLPAAFKSNMTSKIKEVGIELHLNTRIKSETSENGITTLLTTKGEKIKTDLPLWCTYHENNIRYLQNSEFENVLKGDEVLVNDYLQVRGPAKTYSHIFSIGDLPKLDIIKKAGGAYRLAGIATDNIWGKITNDESIIKKFSQENWPKAKMAITVGAEHNVQVAQGKIIVDSESVKHSVLDYKKSKTFKRLGLAKL